MSAKSGEELKAIGLWYTYHKSDAMDITKRLEFLTNTVDYLIGFLALQVEDVRHLENRGPGKIEIYSPYGGFQRFRRRV